MRKYNGSALVWIIPVCAVCVILAMMMLPCCSEQIGSAKAAHIIANMRNLKTSVLAWYADNLDSFDKEGTISGKTADDLAGNPETARTITEYLSSNSGLLTLRGKNAEPGEYILTCGRNSREWLIGCNLDGEDGRVRHKLSVRAKSVGLLNYTGADSQLYDGKNSYVWLHVMTLTGE